MRIIAFRCDRCHVGMSGPSDVVRSARKRFCGPCYETVDKAVTSEATTLVKGEVMYSSDGVVVGRK